MVLGVATGASEAEAFRTEFLRTPADRGLRGVKPVIADDHKGLRAAARRVFNAGLQRCRVHWARNLLAHAAPEPRAAVAAMIRTIFAQDGKAEAFAQRDPPRVGPSARGRSMVADAPRDRHDRLGALMDASREDVLTYMDHPEEPSAACGRRPLRASGRWSADHRWAQIASTNPLERVDKEIKRRADVPPVRLRRPEGGLSASSPTTPPSSVSSAPSCSSSPTKGPSAAATSAWKASPGSPIPTPVSCPP